FVPAGSGGLESPWGAVFGPDGNNDGNLDLYIANAKVQGNTFNARNATVKRYDGVTGAFIDTFVVVGSGGLDSIGYPTFTATDPVTLAYLGSNKLTAASLPAQALNQQLGTSTARPLLTEAIARWQASGADTSSLRGIDLRIANLGGATLGLA